MKMPPAVFISASFPVRYGGSGRGPARTQSPRTGIHWKGWHSKYRECQQMFHYMGALAANTIKKHDDPYKFLKRAENIIDSSL